MKELKFSLLSLIIGLKWTLLYNFAYYVFIFFIFRDIKIFEMWYTHIWPILTTLPDLYIFAGYLLEDYKKKITIGKQYIIDENIGKKYESNEIQKIIIHKTSSEKYKIMSCMYYEFAEIILKNENKIIVTSLTKSNINEFLKENLKGVYFDRDYNYFL